MTAITAIPLKMPLVHPGDDLAGLIAGSIKSCGVQLGPQNVVVVAQKVVSKAEGRYMCLADVTITARAREIAARLKKDPALVALVLQESIHVVRAEQQALIVQHRLGYVMANAGIDQSNLDPQADPSVLLLPECPDTSASRLQMALGALLGVALPVIISDSFGRPWRRGSVGVALGVSGLPAIIDMRGEADLFGRALQVTLVGFADQIASLGCLLMGEGAEGIPAVLVQGLSWSALAGTGQDLIRPAREDLFQ